MSMSKPPRVPEHLRNLAQRFFDAGWTDADVLHALDNPPDGVARVWGDPQRWEVAKSRLALWLDGSMRPILSRSQLLARDNAVKRRMQWLWREAHVEAARRGPADPAAAAARARQILAEASPAAAKAMARRGEKPVTRRDRERWARVDEAAAAAVGSGAVVESWVPESEVVVDPVVVARARAVRRARWERAGRAGENGVG
ncbi:hypothetical protein AB0K21_21525 [Streptosporangium sp. NPDC049248]|uniref:hypothetical protein n=1 Tax=Streptosporangium sp. NPDC049248 TaxID=3155651 RepID=UPI003448FA69